MNSKKFLISWAVLTGIFFTAALCVIYFTDPYMFYSVTRISGFNEIKPVAGTHSRQSKIYAARKKYLDILVIGNSRPELGIDPLHPYFQQNKLNVYNLGMPGSSLTMQYGYALDLIRDQNIKIVLVGIDFADYMVRPDIISNPFQWPPEVQKYDNRKKFHWDGSENFTFSHQRFKDIYLSLVSLGALKDSLSTILSQKQTAKNLTENGFNTHNNIEYITHIEGVKTLFDQKNHEISDKFNRVNWQTYSTGHQWSPELETLSFFLKSLRARNIKTILFINPYHAHYLKMIEMAGLEPEFHLWKRELVNLVQTQDNNNLVQLWDFSTLNAFHSEPILNSGKQPLKWFWEPAHYRKELGDIMIWNMMDSPQQKDKSIPSFGHRLMTETLEHHLDEDLISLRLYTKKHPAEVKYLKQFRQRSANNKP